MAKSIILRGGTVVNPLKTREFSGDIRISGGKIEAIDSGIAVKAGEQVIDVTGKLVMPGLVDMHVHVADVPDSRRMLVKAGVTTALDVAGKPDDIFRGAIEAGAGLNLAYLYPLVPGDTIKTSAPSRQELSDAIDFALNSGAVGVKILGGHYPLTGEATRLAIELSHERRCWITVHAGTVETPGDIRGFEELVSLAGKLPVHIAHINSYCRGLQDNPFNEAKRAFDGLLSVPACRSESYLALINGTSGRTENGLPVSKVTRRCLIQGGYSDDAQGLMEALVDGWAKVNHYDQSRREVVLAEPADGLKLYRAGGGELKISFAVNSPLAAISLALSKKDDGEYAVNALATDGGRIPRNVTLQQGLCLVKYGAMTLPELSQKASMNPARLLGLHNKGILAENADADVIVVDRESAMVEQVISGGRIIFQNGEICSEDASFVTLEEGRKSIFERGFNLQCTAPEWLGR